MKKEWLKQHAVAMVVLVLIVIVGGGILSKNMKTSENQDVTINEVFEPEKIITEETDRYTIEAKYPHFTHAYINEIIDDFVASQIKLFKKDIGNLDLPDSVVQKYAQHMWYTTLIDNTDYTSVLVYNSWYTGGAHPGTAVYSFVFDHAKEERIALANIFEPGDNYLELLAINVQKQLLEHEDFKDLDQEWMLDGSQALPENYEEWGITTDGLVIVFQEYQIGPYVLGSPKVTIPWQDLRPSLDDSILDRLNK